MQSVPGVVRFTLPGGGVALLHPDRRRILVFNYSAHFLWRVLGRGDRSNLSGALSARFGLAPDAAARDADAICDQWTRLGLLDGPKDSAREPNLASVGGAFDAASARMRVRIGTLGVDLRASPSLSPMFFPLWEDRRHDSASADLECVFETGKERRGRLTVNGRVIVENAEPHLLIGAFYRVILERLHPATQFCATMHAGAVALDGNALVMAAPSGSGKSTLIAYLVARGFTYLADDLAALGARDHAVAPFPLPISVKPGAAPALKPFYPELQAEGVREPQLLGQETTFLVPPQPAKALLFPRYSAAANPSFTEISVQDALSRLLAERIFFGLPIEPGMVARFLDWLRGIERRVLVYRDFSEAERCVTEMLRA